MSNYSVIRTDVACASDETKAGSVRLRNSAEIHVLGPQLCTRI